MDHSVQSVPAIDKAASPLPHALRAYQLDGIGFLANSPSALLADEMGLGKTVQSALAMQSLFRAQTLRRALIVCPLSLTLNWEQELHSWTRELSTRRIHGDTSDRKAHFRLPVQVLIATYDHVRSDSWFLQRERPFDLVVLDEAQRVKNVDSDTSLAVRLIPRNRAWALTGTPVENHPADLLSLFRFLKPGLLRRDMPLAEIHARIRPLFLRRTKVSVMPELPPIIVQDWPLELSPAQQDAYDAELLRGTEEFTTAHGRVSDVCLLAQITKLKLICNFEPESRASAKVDALRLILSGQTGPDDRVIVFTQYVETIKQLCEQLCIDRVYTFHGGLTEQERDSQLQSFLNRPGPSILLASLRAAGVGLNMNAASAVVLFDRWWNPAVENQAIHRAHRFGRERPLHVIRFLTIGTVEERIAQILSAKQELFQRIVEEAPTAPLSGLSRADLISILGLHGTA